MAALISSFIPFLKIPVYFSEETSQSSAIFKTLNVISSPAIEIESPVTKIEQIQTQSSSWINSENVLYVIYFIIVSFLVVRILFSINKIKWIIKKYPVEQFDKIRFVNTDEPGTPFSFFRWLFWNRKIELNSDKGQQIFRHELFHIQQNHSWDIIFIEISSTIFWINPFFHLIKKEIKAIHEFLADEFAIKENKNWEYAELLLMQALNTNTHLVNPFFHNQIKRRIAMITLSKKPSYQYLRKIMVLPIATLVVILFAFSYKKKQDNNSIQNALTYITTSADTSKLNNALVIINGVIQEKRGIQNIDTTQFKSKFFNGTVNVYFEKEATNKYGEKGKDGVIELFFDKQGHLFDDLSKIDTIEIYYNTNGQQTSDTIPKMAKAIREKKSPSQQEMDSWCDEKMYGVWVDGKRISNYQLRNYKHGDFASYYVSKLEKNAVNYGQYYYQVDLYSSEYYQRQTELSNSIRKLAIKQITLSDTTKKPQPLLVINGKAMPGLTFKDLDVIDPNNIEKISVLKGDTAINKYGNGAKNGAIEIITKSKIDDITIKDVILEPGQATGKSDDIDNKIFSKVEIEAAFPGGYKEWYKYWDRNLDIKEIEKKGCPPGSYTVVVEFIVHNDGRVTDVKALTNHGYGMEEQSIRLISKGPYWIPAKQNGKNVIAYRKQPITFVIEKK
jgi:hypothetical protein